MFLGNLGSFWLLPFLLSLSFLLSFWLASVCFWCFLLCRGLFFPLNFCQPLHARQWETKIKWKNPRPVFLKNNFEQHWGSASAVQNLSSKNKAPQTQKCPRNTQRQPRNTTGKTDRRQRKESKMTPSWPETSKTVQLYLGQVSPIT